MANEPSLITLGDKQGDVVRRTVADGATIEKYTLCKLADSNVASAATGTGEPFAGIAAAEKVASDGSTTLGFYTSGTFDCMMSAGASCTVGAALCMSGANGLRACVAGDLLTGALVGYAEETGSATERIRVRLRD